MGRASFAINSTTLLKTTASTATGIKKQPLDECSFDEFAGFVHALVPPEKI
jgi:hypothetical protein